MLGWWRRRRLRARLVLQRERAVEVEAGMVPEQVAAWEADTAGLLEEIGPATVALFMSSPDTPPEELARLRAEMEVEAAAWKARHGG